MKEYCIAVFDIGKTNKKLIIFDHNLKLLESFYTSIPEIERNGVHYEDLDGILSWFLGRLKEAAAEYPIGVITVATHGATFVALDEKGDFATPVTSYTTEVNNTFNEDFYRTVGDSRVLQEVTATPRFDALLNVAKGIYFAARKFPDGFARTKHILNYPQYFGYWLTGEVGAESTYVGCHTYLWDFHKNRWSEVADKLGITTKLPDRVGKSWDLLGRVKSSICKATGLSQDTIVTMGIHDSNAALLPYLIKTEGEFVLNSTGTWCVIMHPAHRATFNSEDLGKVVFYNLDAFSNPVKTAIFLGGMEFGTYTEIFKELSGSCGDTGFDRDLYQRLVNEKMLFILPEVIKGSGQFPGSMPRTIENGKEFALHEIKSGKAVPDFFSDSRVATAVLELSLMAQTEVALKRAGFRDGLSLFIEGGFRKDEAYGSLLTALYPQSEICYTSMKEASAFGAAVTGKIAMEKRSPLDLKDIIDIDFSPVPRKSLANLESYLGDFMLHVGVD